MALPGWKEGYLPHQARWEHPSRICHLMVYSCATSDVLKWHHVEGERELTCEEGPQLDWPACSRG